MNEKGISQFDEREDLPLAYAGKLRQVKGVRVC